MIMKIFKRKLHRLKLFLAQNFLQYVSRYGIRQDMFEIYRISAKSLMESPDMRQRTHGSVYDWYRKALHNGERAKTIDPHERIVRVADNALEIANIFDFIFSKISLAATILIFVFGGVSIFLYIEEINSSIITISISIFLIAIKAFFFIYKKFLLLDTEIFHLINEHLIFSIHDLTRMKNNKSTLIAANTWNSALSYPKTIIIIFEMLLLKIFFVSIYGRVYRHLIADVAPYIPEYIRTDKSNKKFYSYMWNRTFPKNRK